ncbi:MAG TPA: phosphoserine phosphatase SerB [Alphaproteobacteria bacterium]|nr:phosphoserine phosphatase SerB [Alphaproteobacteria bacterium]
MQQILTLVAAPGGMPLDDSILAGVRAALEEGDANVAPPRWLAPGLAADLPFAGLPAAAAEAAARRALGGKPFDLLAQASAGRRKELLLADMDSTIVGVETLDELADFAGLKDRVATITERSMRGDIDFVQALEARVAMLAGLPAAMLEEAYKRVVFVPGAEALVRTMRAHGAFTALVSGGFRFFTERVRSAIGFDYDEANSLEIIDGRLTGRVVPPIINRDGKLNALGRLAKERGVALSATLAVGDGANDLAMIHAAGLGVAFRGKPALAAEARARIDHGDLTALLYFQGYSAADFAR